MASERAAWFGGQRARPVPGPAALPPPDSQAASRGGKQRRQPAAWPGKSPPTTDSTQQRVLNKLTRQPVQPGAPEDANKGDPRATAPYRDQRAIPLFRRGGRVRLRVLALRLLPAAAGRLLGPLLQRALVQAHRLPPLDIQLLGVRLLVPVLAGDVVSPAALDALPQPLHHRAVLSDAPRPGGHHAAGGRAHSVVDAETAVGSGSGGGEVPHHWGERLLFWKNFPPRQVLSSSPRRSLHLPPFASPSPPESVPGQRGEGETRAGGGEGGLKVREPRSRA